MAHVILTGFRGCGRTEVGKQLAHKMGYRYLDLDNSIVSLHEEMSGERLPCREIFQSIGPDDFDELQRRATLKMRENVYADGSPCVCVVGVNCLMDEEIESILAPLGKIIYLQGVFSEMWDRIEEQGLPENLETDDARAQFMELLSSREPICLNKAGIVVNIAGETPSAAADRVAKAIWEED